MKLIFNGVGDGQGCVPEPPWDRKDLKYPALFNLTASSTESVELSGAEPALYRTMLAEIRSWQVCVITPSTTPSTTPSATLWLQLVPPWDYP